MTIFYVQNYLHEFCTGPQLLTEKKQEIFLCGKYLYQLQQKRINVLINKLKKSTLMNLSVLWLNYTVTKSEKNLVFHSISDIKHLKEIVALESLQTAFTPKAFTALCGLKRKLAI